MAQGDDNGAGKRGRIDEMRGAELFGVSDAVGENQPALGIGVDHLDGFSGHGNLHVAGLLRAAPGHVFSGRNYGNDFDRRLQARECAHRAEHGRAPGHIELHLLHVVRGLDGNAARVKGDGLTDKPQHRRAGREFFGSVGKHHHARRLHAAARHAEQRTHFQFLDALLV